MVSKCITPENFSLLYASLETLDVTQIVSTLLNIAPLREEIRRQMKQMEPRVRRKRRTRAEMEIRENFVSNPTQPPPYDAVHVREQRLAGPVRRKARKGTPARFSRDRYMTAPLRAHPIDLSCPLQPQDLSRPSPLTMKGEVVSPSYPGGGNSTPSSQLNEPAISANQNMLLKAADINKDLDRMGVNMFNPQHHSLSFPYWNMFRMTANQLLYNYNNMITHPCSPELSSADAAMVSPELYSSVMSTSPPQQIMEQEPDSAQEVNPTETKEETIDPVEEDEEENKGKDEMPEDLSDTNLCVDNDDAEQELASRPTMGDDSSSVEHSMEISCPDCGDSVLLSSLTTHIQTECTKALEDNDVKAQKVSPSARRSARGPPSETSWESCIICSESVPGKDMIKHMRQRHAVRNNPFQCDICDESFRNKSTLKRHKITHTIGGGYACSFCAKIFAKPELLRRHELLHTEMKRTMWPCSKCSKSFSNKYNLAVHDRMHTGELPFPCPECPERFRVKCSMQNHVKSKHPTEFYGSGDGQSGSGDSQSDGQSSSHDCA